MAIFQGSGVATLAGVVGSVMGGVRSWRGKVRSLANLGKRPAAGAVIDAISMESTVRRSDDARMRPFDGQLLRQAAGCRHRCGYRGGSGGASALSCMRQRGPRANAARSPARAEIGRAQG